MVILSIICRSCRYGFGVWHPSSLVLTLRWKKKNTNSSSNAHVFFSFCYFVTSGRYSLCFTFFRIIEAVVLNLHLVFCLLSYRIHLNSSSAYLYCIELLNHKYDFSCINYFLTPTLSCNQISYCYLYMIFFDFIFFWCNEVLWPWTFKIESKASLLVSYSRVCNFEALLGFCFLLLGLYLYYPFVCLYWVQPQILSFQAHWFHPYASMYLLLSLVEIDFMDRLVFSLTHNLQYSWESFHSYNPFSYKEMSLPVSNFALLISFPG